MNILTVGIVAEGPRDVEMISGLLKRFIPNYAIRPLVLQPDSSATPGFGSDYGPRGGGWMGVKRWCELVARDFGGIAAFLCNYEPKIDLFIIHIDADVAREETLNCYAGCPPIQPTIDNLKSVVEGWMGDEIAHPVVLCIPSDNLEAWVWAAHESVLQHHNPPATCIECVQKPDDVISDQNYRPRRLMSRKNGKPDKSRSKYAPLIRTVVDNWDQVKSVCGQAAQFEQDVLGVRFS